MAKKYENLEHTADLKIRAFGKNKEEVFTNMALGMFDNIVDQEKLIISEPVQEVLKVQSNDLAGLLVDFLNQLVYLIDVDDEIYNYFDLAIFQKDKKWVLEGMAKGFKVRGLKTEIKAATYNELKLEGKEGNWVAEVVFDI